MNSVISDAEFVYRTLEGDFEAFGALVQRYQEMVYGVAYSYVRNFRDAQDVTQEVLIKAYQNLAKYDTKRPFGAWLYVIAKRTALDWLRTQSPTTEIEIETERDTKEIADTAPGPEAIAEKREMEHLLRKALESLSDVNRETFCLYHVNGYSIQEISQFLAVPIGTVKRRLHVSRKQLHEEVMRMVEETFDQNKLTWKFTQGVVDKVKNLKNRLPGYIPQEFMELVQMTVDELNERQKKLLRSLADVLSVDLEKFKLDQEHLVSVAELLPEQRDYLYQTLHELELITIISMLKRGTSFTPLIEDFQSIQVAFGLYDTSDYRPYVRFFRRNPDGSQHSIKINAT